MLLRVWRRRYNATIWKNRELVAEAVVTRRLWVFPKAIDAMKFENLKLDQTLEILYYRDPEDNEFGRCVEGIAWRERV